MKKDLIDKVFESENPLPLAALVVVVIAFIYFAPHLIQFLAILITK